MYSIVGYNKNALESHLLATFSNKNPYCSLGCTLGDRTNESTDLSEISRLAESKQPGTGIKDIR